VNEAKTSGGDQEGKGVEESLHAGGVGDPEAESLVPGEMPGVFNGGVIFSSFEGESSQLIPGGGSDPVVLLFHNLVANEAFRVSGAQGSDGLDINAKVVVNEGGDKAIANWDVDTIRVWKKGALRDAEADLLLDDSGGVAGDQKEVVGAN